MSSAFEKSPTESPKLSVTGEKMTSLQLEQTEMKQKLENELSWFLKQNKELLKLLNRLHRQEYDEVAQDKELLDWISYFVLVLLE